MRSLLARLGVVGLAPLTSGIGGVCTAGACAGIPAVITAPLTTALLASLAGFTIHVAAGLIMGPISLAFLIRSFARHRQALGVLIGGAGLVMIFVHYASHFQHGPEGDEAFMYVGGTLLVIGALIDWRVQRWMRKLAGPQAAAQS